MIAVDTNVIIRFLTRDDETQFLKAYHIFKKRDVFIPDSGYGYGVRYGSDLIINIHISRQ